MNDLLQRLDQLSPEKREWVLKKLRQQKQEQPNQTPIIPISRDQPLPLSYAQERLWFLDQLEGQNDTYNIPAVLDLKGQLSPENLQTAINIIIQRHEVLRTAFPTQDGVATLKRVDKLEISLPLLDLQPLSSETQQSEIERLALEEAEKPFNLAELPLLRATLLQLTPTHHLLLFTMHHIISDGWSMGVFIQELSTIYRALQNQQSSPLPPLPIQYVDFAHWQRQWLTETVLKEQLDYWKQQLAGIPERLELPTDYPRPPIQTFNGRTRRFKLDISLSQQLKALAQRTDTSLFMVLLGSFTLLLNRYCRQTDIVIGTPIANRNRSEIEPLIGFFVNTLVFRTDFTNSSTFIDLLQQIRQTALDAYAHQDVPFEKLVEELQPTRNLSYTPLFQVMFALQNAPLKLELADLTLAHLPMERSSAKFDLTLSMQETEQGIVGEFEYNTDLFTAATIDRMANHLRQLLIGISENPQQSIAHLPLLTAEERQQIINWNNTQVDYPKDVCVHQLFEQQVEKTPDAIAVVFEQQQLTYQQLNAKANQLARYLQALGVKAETLVGICVERSLEMVIGLLGILKAGGAYVPLDPSYPVERLEFILEDSQISLLLTQTNLQEHLPINKAQLITLDNEDLLFHQLTTNLDSQVMPENLAYVLFTSGSTGRPKGVMIEHRSAVILLLWAKDIFNSKYFDGVLASTSINFDLSVYELFVPLAWGGKIILIENVLHLPTLLHKDEVVLINSVPSAITELIEIQAIPKSVRIVNLAGEPLKNQLVQSLYKQDNIEAVYNLYGPSEDTTYSTFTLAKKGSETEPTIGRPIAATEVYILTTDYQVLPVGIPGELCIAGAGLARGYLNRPELTAEKFIDIKIFGQTKRVYKTGDLARWLSDGNIEYLGRIDHQIKLRGFRIELGEIETVLNQYPVIKESVVTLYEKAGNKRLVAYISTNDEIELNALNSYLKERLPNYMVPANIILLEKLPLTPNGKIDRHALPTPEDRYDEEGIQAPRNEIEQQLADIWSHILKYPQIGINDNFFSLGGDSILSIQVVSRAQQAGLGLTPRDLFQYQTIAELAQVVKPISDKVAEQGQVEGEVPLTPIQDWFFSLDITEFWHFNQSVLLTVPDDLDEAALEQALTAIYQHHDALRLRYENIAGKWQQKYIAEITDISLHVEVLANFEAEFEQRASDWQASLDLQQGPVTRVVLFKTSQTTRLLWIIHHLVVDGVSWRILLEDLQTAYGQAKAHQAIQLPSKTSSYKAWSEQLQDWFTSEDFAVEADYWRQLPTSLSYLPVDYPEGSDQSVHTSQYLLKLETETTTRLLKEAPNAYQTGVNDLLLSALLLALQEWDGHTQYAIDLESHGRAEIFQDIDLSRTVGWFTALYTVVLNLPAENDLSGVIKHVKEQLRMIPHGGVGYGLLRQHGESLPQAQILFNYLGQFDQSTAIFNVTTDSTGRNQTLTGTRQHLIDINGLVVQGQLQLFFNYSHQRYQSSTIQQFAERYHHYLQKLIDHCQTHYGYTPSDFPLAAIDQIQLDKLTQIYDHNIAAIYPLSPMQQGMLFHTLYEPESGLYFEQIHCRLTGNIQTKFLHQAWQHLIDRHPVLRTVFRYDQNQPLQLVCKQAELPWFEYDWQSYSEEVQQQKLNELLQQERQQSFDLRQAPLMRIQLIRESAHSYRLVWHHHHILLDGWCLPVLFTELLQIYEAFSQQQTPQLPPVNHYQNYIDWLMQQDYQQAKEYWQNKLAGFIAPTPIPISQHTAKIPYYTQRYFTINEAQTEQLNHFVRQQRITLNTLIQTAWAILLGRYSGEKDIVFGATTSGRAIPVNGIETMVGLFINTLPLRINLDDTLLNVLHHVQTQQQQDNQYAYASLVDIQNWSELPNGTALFDSFIAFENYPIDESLKTQSHLPFRLEDFQAVEYTNYPLTLLVIPDQQINLKLSFDQHRFSHDSIDRLLTHLSILLEGIIQQPNTAIFNLPLLTDNERQQIIDWNNTQVDYPKDVCIHQLFEQQVEKTPDAIAVVFEQQQLTYQQLNAKANQLARYLQALGVKAETLVGICVERSLEMVIGLLGILKAGGAYVPLDPTYPQERLAFMLEDAQVPVLLTQHTLVDQLPNHQAYTVYLEDWEKIAHYSEDNLQTPLTPDNAIYVIYTSGSTGKPKGCLINHYNVTRLFTATAHWYQFNNQDVWTLFHSYAFDFSVWEIWGALIYGGRLVVVPYWVSRAPEAFYELLVEQQVTVLNQTPSAFRQLIQVEANRGHLAPLALRYVIFGGEALDFTSLQPWFEQHGDQSPQLVNMYGITETTVHVTYRPLSLEDLAARTSLIGKPIPDLQIYIADAHQNLLPIGVPGEILVGGAGLARGYLNRPELTEEKFIPNPFSSHPQDRLYRTGDLGCWLPDGAIEYLGRIDNQVKIRGFRIELGEIEAVLNQQPSIREAVVTVHSDNDSKRLVAYLTAEQTPPPSTAELRSALSSQLPDYMMPAVYIWLDSLPLTPNGKIDYRALPAPEANREAAEDYVPPQTDAEKTLAQIWSTVLNVEKVGIHDNFFALGGDSILSIQIVSRANQAGIHLTPRLLFQHQTIAELLAVADVEGASMEAEELQGEIPLTPIQHWFFEQALPEQHHYNQHVLLTVPANICVDWLNLAVQAVIAHHDSLRLRFHDTEGLWQQQYGDGSQDKGLWVEDLSGLSPAEQRETIEQQTTFYQTQLNLSSGPLIRVILFHLRPQPTDRLFIVIHHLAVDGVSWRILLEDLATAYHQLEARQAIQLPAKTSSYQTWANHLVEYAQTTAVTEDLPFWEALPKAPALPTDFPETEVTVATVQAYQICLTPEQTRALLQEVPRAYNSKINDVLLTALTLSLAEWLGEPTVLLDLEGHGREDLFATVNLSRTVGWFTAIFPVCLHIDEPDNLGAALIAVKEQLRQIPQQGISYGLLRYLHADDNIRQTLAQQPAAPILFNYLGQFDQTLAGDLWLSFAEESAGLGHSPQQPRRHWLEINSWVSQGQLSVEWRYSPELHQATTIERLAEQFFHTLGQLIVHCQQAEQVIYTPSDFPLANLTQDNLQTLLDKWGGNIQTIYPLSPMQQGMLFDVLYSPHSASYFVHFSTTLFQSLQITAFQQAWQQVVDRHSVLRTFFIWENLPQPLQVVCKQVSLPWTRLDWRDKSAAEQAVQLKEFLEKDKAQGFDLRQVPLMRCTLIQLTDDSYRFIWSHHHILLDGWSWPLILQEVFTLYEKAVNPQTHLALPPAPPFETYIAWLQRQDLQAAKTFWQQQLQGLTAPTAIAIQDDPNALAARPRLYAEYETHFSTTISQAFHQFLREHRLTANTLLQGLWALALRGYSGDSDVVFGTTVGGRPPEIPQIEKMVGMFINTLPVRVHIPDNTPALAWLQSLQTHQVEREHFVYTPLTHIQAWSDMPKDQLLFDSVLVTENYPLDESLKNYQGSLRFKEVLLTEHAQHPLILVMLPGEQVTFIAIYETARFSEATVKRILGHLENLLKQLIEAPDSALNEFNLLTEAEQAEMATWNATAKTYPQACLHQQIEAQVAATPQAVAVIYADQQLTYEQLNQQANQLAHHLQQLGIKPDSLVGICVERSLWMMIGLLGILKAGGAYVPIDPTYPAERLAFMLADSQVPLLLTQHHLIERLPNHQATVICLDREWEKMATQPTDNLNLPAQLDQLAYVIYTSGSTGKPKGAMNSHLAISNRLLWMQDAYQLTAQDRVLQKTPFSFDVSVWEFFWPLLSGATLVFAKPEGHKDADYLVQIIAQARITTLHFVPSMLHIFLQAKGLNRCRHLRQVFCSGEALPLELQNRFFAQFPAIALYNLYGPTEAAVDVTHWTCNPRTLLPVVPIGQPIANLQMAILNTDGQPIPKGVAGELHIAGIGLARGYWQRPELTAEKFIIADNPTLRVILRRAEASRLYKTGDLARYLPDGNIEYLGRIDQQIKIRGFRVELGEIEAVLMQHATVQEAAVLLQQSDLEDAKLIAFIVGQADSTPENSLEETDYIAQVSEIYKHTYGAAKNGTLDFNVAGWNSSYTGEPIPSEEMQEWVNGTVNRIRHFMGKAVLEIGCGTGLLLSRLAPDCQTYWGLDLSIEALQHVDKLRQMYPNLRHVQLFHRAGDDFTDIPAQQFDTVIINSVVQHFPSIDYLLQVIRNALQAVKPGGKIFIGDVRNLLLLKAYHLSVQQYQADETITLAELQQRVEKRIAEEEELLVDPSFFSALKTEFPTIQHAVVYPRRGRYANELTKFRYDAVLWIDKQPVKTQIIDWQIWSASWSVEAIKTYLQQQRPTEWGLQNVINQRLSQENQLLYLLTQQPDLTLTTYQQQRDQTLSGIDPEELWRLEIQLPHYSVEISWTYGLAKGAFDVAFRRVKPVTSRSTSKVTSLVSHWWQRMQSTTRHGVQNKDLLPVAFRSQEEPAPWSQYANQPLQSQRLQPDRTAELRQFLQTQLPDYMVPAQFVWLDNLPLTPNGKVDRKALAQMEISHQRSAESYVAPRTETETTMVKLWEDILAVQPVGINDNFFEFGGHSLLAIRLMAKIQEQFKQNLPLATLFENPTVAGLATVLESGQQSANWRSLVAVQPRGNRPAFFCVPGAGGNVIYFERLAHYLGKEQPFYGLQSEGLDGITQPPETIEEIAANYVAEIKTVQSQGPYFIGGHSFGAHVAYEMARLLAQQGQEVGNVIILDNPALVAQHELAKMAREWDDVQWLARLLREMGNFYNIDMGITEEQLRPLTPDERLWYIYAHQPKSDLLPSDVTIEQLRGLVTVFKNDHRALAYYQPPGDYHGRITLLKATDSHFHENLFIDSWAVDEEKWGWQQVTTGKVEVYHIAGNHFNLLVEPYVKGIARIVRRCLEQ